MPYKRMALLLHGVVFANFPQISGNIPKCYFSGKVATRCDVTWLQSQALIGQHEKRERQFDRLVDEWKRKVLDLQTELDSAQKEARSNAAEVYKLKAQLDENRETIDALRRENKNLSGI